MTDMNNLKRQFIIVVGLFCERRFWFAIFMTLMGSALAAYSVQAILAPMNTFAGGLAGLALIIHYFTEQPSAGIIYSAINIPVMLLAWKGVSLRFLVISFIGNIIFTFWLVLFETFPPLVLESKLIASIFAGVITGIGSGLYLRYGGSVGGLDIIGTFIKKKFSLPIGNAFMFVNGLILLMALIIYNIDAAIYSALFMYTLGYAIEKTQAGFSQRKSIYIITRQTDRVAREVLKELDRGYTLLHAEGGYSGKPIKVIYAVINRLEIGRLKQKLIRVDPQAFLVVNTATEVIGNRFLSWEDDGYELSDSNQNNNENRN